MEIVLLDLAPRGVLKAELAARAAKSSLYPGLAQFSDEALLSKLELGTSALKGQHPPHDDRHEPFVYGDPQQQHCANGVAAIVPARALAKPGDYWTLARSTACAADDTSLCAWERFAQQPRFGCKVNEPLAWSACLVHESHVLTCRHNHEIVADEQHYAVFGFVAHCDEFFEPRFELQDVVPISGVVCTGRPDSDEEDWAVLSLERPVQHRPVLEVAEMPASWWHGHPQVYTLGHPIDLPMKLTDGAWAALHPTMQARFLAPLDTYGGCSGSPVFGITDDARHVVMGIVSQGQLGQPNFDRSETEKCWYRHVYRYRFPDVIGQSCVRARVFEECIARLHGS